VLPIEIGVLIEKGTYILADVLAMDNSTVGAAPRLFCGFFSEITYIRTIGNSTLLKIYTLPNHTITIDMCNLETQLSSLLYGRGASYGQKWSMPWMSANIQYRSLFY
jgi:hypothetical protein